MTAILPKPSQGNEIVTPVATGDFPTLILSTVIVAAGIYVVDQYDSRAAWLLAFLVLLTVAFRYKGFGNEILGLLNVPITNQKTASTAVAPKQPPTSIVVGPTGPITA